MDLRQKVPFFINYTKGHLATVTGTDAINLPKARPYSLKSLTAFGDAGQLPQQYIDSVTLSGGAEQRNLPDEYIQQQYIYMMEGSYLLTDIVPTSDMRIEFDFQTLTIASGARTYLGCRDSSGSNDGLRVAHISSGVFRIYGFGTFTDSATVVQANTRYKFVWNNKQATITTGGTTIFDNTFAAERTNQTAVAINGWNTAGTVDANSEGMYLYSFKVWDNQGNLIADYVPAVQKGTVPVVGFYDTVSKTFMTATAGTFSAGGEAVPTPDYPLDIVSNNGVLKARHQSGLPLGYTLLEYIESTGTQYISLNLNNTTRFVVTAQNSALTTNNQVLLVGDITANAGTWIGCISKGKWGAGVQEGTYASIDSTTKVTIDVTFQGTGGLNATINNETIERIGTTANIAFCLFATSNSAYGFKGKIFSLEAYQNGTLVRNMVLCKNSSNVVGMYDTVTNTFFTNAGTGDFVAGNAVSDPVEIYADGTVETIEDSLNNTATTEMLLKVGNYQDVQSIIDGVVTRNVGVKVLDGTEDYNTSTLINCWTLSENVGQGTFTDRTVYCTHFNHSTTLLPATDRQGYAFIGNAGGSYTVGFGATTQFTTQTQWKQWLADQYAAGTPVIIVYPLATPTTETVAGQFLSKSPVTQTAGSISNLPITVTESSHTVPTPQQPLDINCNNGVLKARHQSGLPLGYTLLDYVSFDGTSGSGAYIDTGIKFYTDIPNNQIRIKAKAKVYAQNNWQVVCGNLGSLSAYVGINPNNYIAYGFGSNDAITSISNPEAFCIFDLDLVNRTYKVTNVSTGVDIVNVSEITPITQTSVRNIMLGGYDNAAGTITNNRAKMDFEYAEIYKNGVLVSKLIPCKNSLNVVGVYDTVRNVFLTNTTGSTNLSAGNPVSDPVEIYTDGITEIINVHSKNLFDKNAVSIVAPTTSRSDFIRVIPGVEYSMSARGASVIIEYDSEQTAMQTLYIGASTYTPTAGTAFARFNVMNTYLDTFQIERGSTATDYVPYYNGGTATEEMLLKVGNYQDVQSILDGGITRNVGVKVLDGSENITLSQRYDGYGFYFPISGKNATVAQNRELCTHFDKTFSYSSYNEGLYDTTGFINASTTVNDIKQFLADQYNAGTPVTVIYPLATPTTETVTGQTLQVQKGNNIVEIIQASMDDLKLEATYRRNK